mmetsp:Transcript_57164/g.185765  ORF Transcript_57164/g.185765 Transcript_57164/m.185765 type:complete len:241 (+) Transcript_57164:361-1083(+)
MRIAGTLLQDLRQIPQRGGVVVEAEAGRGAAVQRLHISFVNSQNLAAQLPGAGELVQLQHACRLVELANRPQLFNLRGSLPLQVRSPSRELDDSPVDLGGQRMPVAFVEVASDILARTDVRQKRFGIEPGGIRYALEAEKFHGQLRLRRLDVDQSKIQLQALRQGRHTSENRALAGLHLDGSKLQSVADIAIAKGKLQRLRPGKSIQSCVSIARSLDVQLHLGCVPGELLALALAQHLLD